MQRYSYEHLFCRCWCFHQQLNEKQHEYYPELVAKICWSKDQQRREPVTKSCWSEDNNGVENSCW
jgi:hypothetical protein